MTTEDMPIADLLEAELDAEIKIAEALQVLSPEQRTRIGSSIVAENLTTYPQAAATTKDILISFASSKKELNKKDPDYIEPERFSVEMGVDGMVHILRDKGTVEGAYSVVAEKHNKELSTLKTFATKEHYNRSQIIDRTTETIPIEISKIREIGFMTMIEKPTTINSMFDNTYTVMMVLGELYTLREEMRQMKVRQTATEIRVGMLEGSLSPDKSCRQALKVEIKRLLKEGSLTRKEISQSLGVSVRTIANYYKELTNETTL